MKKMIPLAAAFAALTLTASAAFAATANATIVAPNTEKITAPFAGTLLAFDLRQGDSVAANETLFTMDTTPPPDRMSDSSGWSSSQPNTLIWRASSQPTP